MGASEHLVLINQNIGTRDYLPGDFDKKTFVDVEKWLKEKYFEQIVERLRTARAEVSLERTTFKFERIDPAGQLVPLGPEMTVGEAKKLTKEVFWIAEPYGGGAVVSPLINGESVREWWHQILSSYGRYHLYGVILALPSDSEIICYMKDFGRELHLVSGNDCLVIALTNIGFRRYEFDDQIWSLAMNEHISRGYCLKVADLFKIKFDEFPCLILFRDPRSPDHILVTLKGLTVEEISQNMRSIFSIAHEAVLRGENPLLAIKKYRDTKAFMHKGGAIISGVREVAGKTFETAMKALVEAVIR